MKSTLTIAGWCVNHYRKFKATVTISRETGLIIDLDLFDSNADIVLSEDHLIFPGFIDVHVHGREDTSKEEIRKEDFYTLGQAAVNGGIIHVCEMGNNPVPPIDDESYAAKEALTHTSVVPVTLYAMIGPNTRPLKRRVPYKMCLARTTGKNDLIFFPNYYSVEEAAKRYRGQHVSFHAEDSEILKLHANEPLHENRRPDTAEWSAINRSILLIERYFGRGKICHCSVCTGIDQIYYAKQRGVPITCEVAPHHLYFDVSMITEENAPWMQMNPPLRSPKDRLSCIEDLKHGKIDMIASDHAPHLPAEKNPEDKTKRASGQPHLDTFGPFTTWLMEKQGFNPQNIARVCSFAPAQFLKEFLPESYGNGYGQIEVGFVGSLTVIDMATPVTVSKEMLKTKCGWSPFEGVTFPGSVAYTIVKGRVLKGLDPTGAAAYIGGGITD